MTDTPTKLFDMAQNLRDAGNRLSEDGWESTGNAIIDYCKTIDEAAHELAETKRLLAGANKDAERYRWLKDQQRMAYGDTAVINWNIGHDWQRINSENLDAAIDAAIKEQK